MYTGRKRAPEKTLEGSWSLGGGDVGGVGTGGGIGLGHFGLMKKSLDRTTREKAVALRQGSG